MTMLGKTWRGDKNICKFKHRVDDSDYETEIITCAIYFDNLIKVVMKTEQDIEHHASHQTRENKWTHRFKADGVKKESSDNTPEPRKGNKDTVPNGK